MSRRLHLTDYLSQYTMVLTSNCSYSCYECPIKKKGYQSPLKGHDYKGLIKEDRFFEVFPKKRVYNIVGGDPFDSPDLLPVLIYLHRAGIKVRLWTHGAVDLGTWKRVSPYVDYVFLYVPAPDQIMYREISGVDGWDRAQDTISYLKEISIPVAVNMPLRSEVISFLADCYEFVYGLSVSLCLHYRKKEQFQTDSLAYIRRFSRVSDVNVFRSVVQRTHCVAVSIPHSSDPFSFYRYILKEFCFVLYQRWNPLFILRRWLG